MPNETACACTEAPFGADGFILRLSKIQVVLLVDSYKNFGDRPDEIKKNNKKLGQIGYWLLFVYFIYSFLVSFQGLLKCGASVFVTVKTV